MNSSIAVMKSSGASAATSNSSMTARRGSLRYKIVRFAREPHASDKRMAHTWRLLRRTATLAGRAVFAIALLFVGGTVGAQVWRVGAENVRLHNQTVAALRENVILENNSQNLTARIQKLHDPEYLVPLIHEQLGLTKPHEIFVELKPQPELPPQK